MLWKKNWWDTRGLFLLTLSLTIFSCVWSLIMGKPADPADHQKLVWVLWFRFILTSMWPILALTMVMTFLGSLPSGATGLFTLSLPITRRKIILSHWVVVMMEMTATSLASVPLISMISRFNGRWFPMKDAFLYSLFIGIGGMAFVSLSYLLVLIVKKNAWALIGPVTAVNILLHWPQWVIEGYPWWNVFHAMSGESYFHHSKVPWPGLLASFAVSALMMLAAVRIYERRNF